MLTLGIFWGGEFILVVLWIIVLVFAFDMDCPTEPLSARSWLLTGAFLQLIFDIVASCIGGFFALADEESRSFAITSYIFTLILNVFQICWFAVGFKVLTTMDCDQEWVMILAQVTLGLAVLRIPKIVAFLVFECRK